MSLIARHPALAPFRIRAFRFQWPADLTTSWAFEMETLILGWYVLVETGSVLLLTVFASLQHIGTLVSPVLGMVGDRIGHRLLLTGMRALYATLAATLMTLAYMDALTPTLVLCIAGVMGMVRPSDVGVRSAVVAASMPAPQLISAMGLQRTTQDSARIAGALSGAGLVALLGMGAAYTCVTALYLISTLLTLKAGSTVVTSHRPKAERASPWRDLKDGLAYVWNTPFLFAVMLFAFLLNLTVFPLMNGLMPYVVKSVYLADQTTLGYMVASAATGALTGSLIMSRYGSQVRAARMNFGACVVWFLILLVFAQVTTPTTGMIILFFAGCAHSIGQIPMATMLLRNSEERMRGRVMGIRVLAIYGNIPGLLLAGPLIANFGYPVTATIYCVVGLACTILIAVRWRAHVWDKNAPANRL